jgi:hypothetical protein
VFGSVSGATQKVDKEEKKDEGRAMHMHIGSLSRGSIPAPALGQTCKVRRKGSKQRESWVRNIG